MFVPPAFAVDDLSKLHDFIVRNSFGLVISLVDGVPFGTHLPILLRRSEGPFGTLTGHFARANPQWQQIADQTSLLIFSGPHAYISPTWYEAPNTVPTWNYTAVHATGRVELSHDREALRELLAESVDVYERAKPQPWSFDSSTVFAERLMEQIVGFRMVIEKLEGKFKLNQNHPPERREKVIRELERQGDEQSRAVAELMKNDLPPGE